VTREDAKQSLPQIVQLFFPALLAMGGSYLAVRERITAVEVRIEERTQDLRRELAETKQMHQRDVDGLRHQDEVLAGQVARRR